MASQGPLSPGTITDDASVGSVAWSNPSNAGSSDNNHATASIDKDNFSHYLKATNFGFSIPLGAIITGVTVEIERKSTTNGTLTMSDETVKLVKGGTVSGDNKATGTDWPSSDTIATYGSSSDLWGLTLTDTDINASNFGLALAIGTSDTNTLTIGPANGSVDHIRITVYYTSISPTIQSISTIQGVQSITL